MAPSLSRGTDIMADYIPTRKDVDELQRRLSLADAILRMVTLKAIWTALVASTTPECAGDVTTAAISKGSPEAPHVEEWFLELQQKGLKVTNGTTTFIVTL